MTNFVRPVEQRPQRWLANLRSLATANAAQGTEYIVDGEGVCRAIIGNVTMDPQGNSTGLSGWGFAVLAGEWLKLPGSAEGKVGPEGKTGKEGPAGPEGKTGKEGPAGPEGKTGPEGKEGPAGKEGKEGKAGPEGKEGKEKTYTGEKGINVTGGVISPESTGSWITELMYGVLSIPAGALAAESVSQAALQEKCVGLPQLSPVQTSVTKPTEGATPKVGEAGTPSGVNFRINGNNVNTVWKIKHPLTSRYASVALWTASGENPGKQVLNLETILKEINILGTGELEIVFTAAPGKGVQYMGKITA